MRNERVMITQEDINAYARQMKEKGKSLSAIGNHRRMLRDLYAWLPEDKLLGEAEVEAFLEERHAQNSVGTINNAVAAFNGFMRFMDHRELCLDYRHKEERSYAELTREEYLRLLAAGRRLRDRGGYILVKLFGNTPLRVQELKKVTVEAAKYGVIHSEDGKRITLPEPLRRELLDYAELEGITGGIIFRTRSGTPIDRGNLNRKISELGAEAKVDSEKVNPRCLRRLHLKMMQELQAEYEEMILKNYERQLNAEQRLIGWTDGIGAFQLAVR